jgi:hypothetical protein
MRSTVGSLLAWVVEPELYEWVEWFAAKNGTSLSIAGRELIRIAQLATYAD